MTIDHVPQVFPIGDPRISYLAVEVHLINHLNNVLQSREFGSYDIVIFRFLRFLPNSSPN